MEPWYAATFDERYLAFYEELLDRTVAADDAEFVEQALALPAASSVLDLGCGFGRHAICMALRGYRVTGLDLSPSMLAIARDLAQSSGAEVEWLHRDMRDLSGLRPFSACICLYTVFGYFDDNANAAVLRGVYQALRPGGLFMLDVSNPLALTRGWPARVWRESASGLRLESARYDGLTGRFQSQRTLIRPSGERVELRETDVRLYAPYELSRLLQDAGFDCEQVYGGLRDEPLQWDRSPRQVWVARRRC